MQVIEKRLDEIKPYEKNPRKNDKAVDPVAESLREFGWQQPLVIDADGVLIAGHTRYKAAKKLGWTSAPCVVADTLTPEQVKAYRLADNKVAEVAEWDATLLPEEMQEIAEIDMSLFGFEDDDMPQAIDLDDDKPKASKETVCHCPKCGFEFNI